MFEGMGGGMGAGMLGLGLASDAFGAYSAYQQQQRQRDLYRQQLDMAAKMRDPGYMIGQAQPYYQANMQALRAALPSLERASINPEIGMRGLSGGAAQSLYDQVVGQQQQQAWNNALASASGGMQGGMQAMQGAGQNIGQNMGGMGGTANALQQIMMWQALRGGTGKAGTATTGLATPSGGTPQAGGAMNPYTNELDAYSFNQPMSF